MKIWLRSLVMLGFAGLVMIACTPYVLTSSAMKNKTATYYGGFSSAPNGHDVMQLTFDSSGTAGTLEIRNYTYDFATQAAVTSGAYTAKTWFQNNGGRGTFTWDPTTMEFDVSINEGYLPTPGTTPMTNTEYAAADYSYQAMKTFYGDDSYSMTMNQKLVLTQDNLLQTYLPGAAANTWVNTTTTTTTTTSSGVPHTQVQTSTLTLTVQGTSFSEQDKTVTTDSQTGQPTTTETNIRQWDFSVAKYFVFGGDTGAQAFSEVWKKGNTVTFLVNQTQYSRILYDGSSVPAAPAVDPVTGQGGSDGSTAPVYYIDRSLDPNAYSVQIDLQNAGDYVTYATAAAYRQVAE